MHRSIRFAVAIAMAWTVVIPNSSLADDDEQLRIASAEREAYGLPTSPDLVRNILETGSDIGTDRWGIVLTAEEEASLDLVGRMEFVDLMRPAIEFAQGQPTYGGAYVDQAAGGNLVMAFTQRDKALEGELLAMVPEGPRALQFIRVEHTLAELEVAARASFDLWHALSNGRPLLYAGVDEELNSLRLGVLAEDSQAAAFGLTRIVEGLGVPVAIEFRDIRRTKFKPAMREPTASIRSKRER
jgi:hypothetical protein